MGDDGKMAPVETVRPRLTFADLERMPDDGRRYELYNGEVFVVPSPLPRHQIVQHRLTEVLSAYSRQHGGLCVDSPIDIVFSDSDVLQPDIVYFSPARKHLIDLNSAIRHPPDLCVEILSPSTAERDRGRKMEMFARFGVKEYWIVDPAGAALEQYGLEAAAYELRVRAMGNEMIKGPLLPGLSFEVQQIFQDII